MLETDDMRFVNPTEAFINCFNCDKERENYMYMYSIKDTHYFKHIDTREYMKIERKGLNTEEES